MSERLIDRLARALLPEGAYERWLLPALLDIRADRAEGRVGRLQVLGRSLGCVVLTCWLAMRHPPRRRHRQVEPDPGGTMWIDVRYACRLIRRQAAFSLGLVSILGASIGAATAVFSVVNAVLWTPLPYDHPADLMALNQTFKARPGAVSPVNFYDWVRQTDAFDGMALYRDDANIALSGDGEPEPLSVATVSASLFAVLRTRPLFGRTFVEEEDRAGREPTVVLGHALWQRRYGGDRGVLGRAVRIDGIARTIVGVMPAGFAFPADVDVWVPLEFPATSLADGSRGAVYMEAVARLAASTSVEQARAAMAAIGVRLAAEYPNYNAETGVLVRPLFDTLVERVRIALLVLLAAVGLVLLIAIVNAANLLVARATTRRLEMSVRLALGATRSSLVRQLLVEHILLALASGAAGILIAHWGVGALLALAPSDLPHAATPAVNARALIFALTASLLAGLSFGLAPIVAVVDSGASPTLHAGRGQAGASRATERFRQGLVIAEVALAAMLLVTAGLAVTTFRRLVTLEPGFEPAHVVAFDVTAPSSRYDTAGKMAEFFRTLTDRLRDEAGVERVGAVSLLPLARGRFGGTFVIADEPEPPDGKEPRAQIRAVTPGYLETMRIPVVAGRSFDERDREDMPLVALISETAARQFWPGANPVGRRIRVNVNTSRAAPHGFREIVGIVKDVRFTTLEAEIPPLIYVPHAQYLADTMSVAIRTDADPATIVRQAQRIVNGLDGEIPLTEIRTLEAHVARAVGQPRFAMTVLSAFGVVSLGLAAFGLYGVVSYSVRLRRREIGVRVALGATRAAIVGLVLRRGLGAVTIGTLVGLVGATLLTRVMASMLAGTSGLDPTAYAAAALALVAAGLCACLLPSFEAVAVDPSESLRIE